MSLGKTQVQPGWIPINDTTKTLGFIQVHRFGRFGWMESTIATWRDDGGFVGWFNHAGEYLSPIPTHWKPLYGGIH